MPLVDKWRYQHMNKLVDREVFINSVRVQSAFRVSLVQERPQIVIFWVEWFGSLKQCATDLEASLLSFTASPFFPFFFFFSWCAGYAADGISEDTFKSIVDVDGLFRS